MRGLRAARRIDDVEAGFVGRVALSVRAVHIPAPDAEHSVHLVQTIDAKRQFLLGLLPEIVAADTSSVVAEPDGSVGLTTTSLGPVSLVPSKDATSTVTVPLCSVRVSVRLPIVVYRS